MKIALLYWPFEDESEHGRQFSVDETEYHLLIDSVALLPVGSEIHLIDKTTGEGIDFIIVKWHYHPDHNLLCLQVIVDVNCCEISAENFKKYIQANWLFGNKIYKK